MTEGGSRPPPSALRSATATPVSRDRCLPHPHARLIWKAQGTRGRIVIVDRLHKARAMNPTVAHRWWWLLVAAVVVFAACSGTDDEASQPTAGGQQTAAASQTEQGDQPAAETKAKEAQVQVSPSADEDGEADVSETEEPEEVTQADPDAPFHPDTADLTQLVFWGPLDGYFGTQLRIPDSLQGLLERLLGSDAPAVDGYVIDLAAFPNPYRGQVMEYLRERYDTDELLTIFDYPEIFDFDPSETVTLPYLRFKQALFAGQFTDMAAMMDPDAPRTIDAREVMWGGVRVDGIPPLESPAQLRPEQAADWINDSDEVIGIEINGDARAYPIRIIAWHEMVNDTIGGVPVSLAYCTLCGSAILYHGRLGAEVYRFGTSGLLYRSNKLMYDRTTRTLWNQFSGQPAWGPLVDQGIRLEILPVVLTTWGDWHARHPDSTVLSLDTGFARNYGPGVAYAEYNSSPNTWFNVPIRDERLAAKDHVYVVRVEESLTAYPTALLASRTLVEDEVGGLAIVVVATANGKGGRSYAAGDVRFALADPAANTLTDTDGGVWRIREDSLQGPRGKTLPRVSGHNAFWFALLNQTTNAKLYEG